MYDIFNAIRPGTRPVAIDPNWNYVKEGLLRDLQKVLDYHHTRPTAVKSDHILVRLLQTIPVSKTLDNYTYYQHVSYIADELSQAFRFTSSVGEGKTFDGTFYGQGSCELLISTEFDDDVERQAKKWEDIQAVKVLRHDLTDLSFTLPDGNYDSPENNMAVIGINIPLLALQYKMFRENEDVLNPSDDSERSVMMFVRMYAITNMMPSHLDQVIINRFLSRAKGWSVSDMPNKHSFHLVQYEKRVEETINEMFPSLYDVNKDFYTLMDTIPTPASGNMTNFSLMPNNVPTMQIKWALSIARIPELELLVRLAGQNGNAKNGTEMNAVKRSINWMENNGHLRGVLPHHMYMYVRQELDVITDVIDK